ncbi:MAG: selenocysteine-specific translation elongation factor [Rhodocyclaceae bacterium]|jgi:selenocysteine-specific elongation factor|nr:selenocysteine-specific translation elongation factor [Rhodocyclaceae bacterium]MBK6554144.1 selenocysteine-specific translation elongation factor [Rhodocyclaceae bacterium]MBK9310573.1 selenocysteine-specific translation elongation factor [Rhodocyclaceae bacterium]MBK9954356.1 selenocysteine-specific translation elongation factor [Rhodocyclaceae bacterium]
MIVATAGHVDHGKTSLVKTLTGVDTDRLEEEKRRGMTIDLGYAYRPTTSGKAIGFIDVPGHRRFLHNMIAGISGIDLGLVVVDAGEGVKPQTHEHLQVLRHLGVTRTLIALTKIDRAEPAQRDAARRAIAELLPDSPIFPVSNLSGEGIAALGTHLDQLAGQLPVRGSEGLFRLSLDRCFLIKGAGLVVAGTVAAGRVRIGDSLRLFTTKAGDQGVPMRVRGLRVHNQPAETGQAGQRCALNLVGEARPEDIERGDWLCAADTVTPCLRFDALGSGDLQAQQRVRLHIGAKRMPAQALQLDDEGHWQLLLPRALPLAWGDRFLIQDESGNRILGGGRVLAPHAPRRGRRRPERLHQLRTLALPTPGECLAQALRDDDVIDWPAFRRAANLSETEGEVLLADCADLIQARQAGAHYLLTANRWSRIREHLLTLVRARHSANPAAEGLPQRDLLRPGTDPAPSPVLAAALQDLLADRTLVPRGAAVATAGFRPQRPPALEEAWAVLRDFLARGGSRIPLFSEMEKALPVSKKDLFAAINLAVHDGRLQRVSRRRVALPEVIGELRQELRALAGTGGRFSVIEAKTHLGLGRDLTIEILEYFDAARVTRRVGNVRQLTAAVAPC